MYFWIDGAVLNSICVARTEGPSPSALFAHRLMHYCCEEVIPGTDPHGMYEARYETVTVLCVARLTFTAYQLGRCRLQSIERRTRRVVRGPRRWARCPHGARASLRQDVEGTCSPSVSQQRPALRKRRTEGGKPTPVLRRLITPAASSISTIRSPQRKLTHP